MADTGWVNPTFANGWGNYGGIYSPMRFRKRNGLCFAFGTISGGTIGNVDAVIAPAGFDDDVTHKAAGRGGIASYAGIEHRMNGNIRVQSGTNQFIGIAWMWPDPNDLVDGPSFPSDTGWISANLVGTWSNVGGSRPITRYRKIDGIVFLDVHASGGNNNEDVFILPPGFRPESAIIGQGSKNNNGDLVAGFDIQSNGGVRFDHGGPFPSGAHFNGWFLEAST